MPVYRGADAVVAQLQQGIGGIGFGPQAIAVLGAAVASLWAVNGWWVGRRHDTAAAAAPGTSATPAGAARRALGARP